MKTHFGIHAVVLSDINLTGKSSIRFRFCAVLNGQNSSVEEADHRIAVASGWMRREGRTDVSRCVHFYRNTT